MTTSNAFLTFCGGVDTVTGSRFLVESEHSRVLLDRGLFQGGRNLRERNWADPPFAPKSIDAVVMTHGHLDHSGYLPVVVRCGFNGKIHCTPGTRDLLDVLLHDAAHIEEEDAAYANKKSFSRHRPALPLFDTADVDRALERVVVHHYHDEWQAAPGVRPRGSRGCPSLACAQEGGTETRLRDPWRVSAAQGLASAIRSCFGWSAGVAQDGEGVSLCP